MFGPFDLCNKDYPFAGAEAQVILEHRGKAKARTGRFRHIPHAQAVQVASQSVPRRMPAADLLCAESQGEGVTIQPSAEYWTPDFCKASQRYLGEPQGLGISVGRKNDGRYHRSGDPLQKSGGRSIDFCTVPVRSSLPFGEGFGFRLEAWHPPGISQVW